MTSIAQLTSRACQRAGAVNGRVTVLPLGLSSKDCSFSRCVHEGQFIGESLALSHNDGPIVLGFLGARLPCCNMAVFPGAEYTVQDAADGAERHVAAMQGSQRPCLDGVWLGKEDLSSLAIGGGSRKQVLDLVERKAAILQLGRAALGNVVHRRTHLAQGLESLIAAANICQLSAWRDNIVVPQLVAFSTFAPHRHDHDLAIAHGLWIGQTEDSDRLELACENFSAFANAGTTRMRMPAAFSYRYVCARNGRSIRSLHQNFCERNNGDTMRI